MSIAAILIGLSLLIVAIPIVAGPVVNEKRERQFLVDGHQEPEALARYQETLVALQDLEFDRQLGVISEDDYETSRAQLLTTAAHSLEATTTQQAMDLDAKIEAAVRTRRQQTDQSTAKSLACYQCGEEMAAEDKFCTVCGSRATPVCPGCGRQSNPGDKYCAACGANVVIGANVSMKETS
jgi:rRNA maturation endonuclease Nob1